MAESSVSSSHTPLPPTAEDDRLDRLRLLRSRRVGIATYHRLIGEHGSARAALEALPAIAREAGISDYAPCPVGVARAELAAGHKAGAQLIMAGDTAYPEGFTDVADAPPLFWAKGQVALLARPSVALVGARNASSLGLRMARALARDLGEAGVLVSSGLARGIDTAAHTAALPFGTIAVMAGGIDVIYPAENAKLAAQIIEDGLLITEQPPGVTPQARHFPARNRILSALARAVVVVEAAARSGSLITAKNALDQGREVMAVPGHPFDARVAGCNLLLRDGATLVRGAEDVIEALGPFDPPQRTFPLPPAPAPTSAPIRSLDALHRAILDRLAPAPMAEDDLRRDMGLRASDLGPALLQLELDGKVDRQPGGLLSRNC